MGPLQKTSGPVETRPDVGVDPSTRLGAYLKNLREGYRYTLRKVEERAEALGEAIDNSQLSRFEKGKAIPSFEKLRALARVFNVPVQNFSDVLDLEEYRDLRPAIDDYDALMREGADLRSKGEHGCAFVTFERAMEVAERGVDPAAAQVRQAEARLSMAIALKRLGKLYMAEAELRKNLRDQALLPTRLRLRSLLQLAYLYRELGDLYLASVLAKESLALAQADDDRLTVAGVLNTLGNIAHDDGDPHAAVDRYREALTVLDDLGVYHERHVTVLTNLGGSLSTLGTYEEGMSLLKEAHARARQHGFRRLAALSLTRLAEAHQSRDEHDRAREMLDDSDALASRAGQVFYDILFLNAYIRWDMARVEGHGTREKIAFGRLRHLRSLLQRRFAEVDAFDRYVERNRT